MLDLNKISNGSSNTEITTIETNSSIGDPFRGAYAMSIDIGSGFTKFRFMETPQTNDLTDSEIEFRTQKRLFEQIPPLLLRQYDGLFIASRNGEIVDTDADIDILMDRFFARYGEVPVYITRIGEPIREFIDTPF
jgi:hypothetical protein